VLRVGLYPGPHAAEADANSHCALDAVARRVLERGMEVKPMVLPHQLFAALGEANRTILAYEGARASGDDYRRGAAQLGPATRSLIVTGQRIGDDVYQKACLLAQDCARRFADAMQDFDLLLTFSAPGRAPLATTGTGASTFNRAWTTIGVPCLTLPIPAQSPGQLPLGVQLVGTRGGDGALLAHGALIEEALKDFQSHQVHKARQAAGAAGC
jgi:Asp-tRNA(Asn)/Glu-tRNA(Gln) amidotransferase A subunit family amidase